MTTLRTGLLAGFVACVVLFGGLWFLNNTRAGLGIKCSVLNDVGACFIFELSAPAQPLPTEDPVVVAERERQAEEQRRQAAVEQAQREADGAVARVSSDLHYATDALAATAEAASDEADSLGGPTLELQIAVDDMRDRFDELAALVAAGSTGEFWVDDVSFALYDVEFARDDVDFARDGVEFAAYAIEDAGDSRDGLARDVDVAIAALKAAQRLYPDAVSPGYAVAHAEADLQDYLASVDESLSAYQEAQSEVERLLAEADNILAQATEVAASVGAE